MDYRATTDKATVINLKTTRTGTLHGEGSGTTDGQELFLNAATTRRSTPPHPDRRDATVAGTRRWTSARHGDRRAQPSNFRATGEGAGRPNWVWTARIDPAAPGGRGRGHRPGQRTPLTVLTTERASVLRWHTSSTHARRHQWPDVPSGDGFALETQHYPDSPNQPNFPSTVLRPGNVYQTTTVYHLSVAH